MIVIPLDTLTPSAIQWLTPISFILAIASAIYALRKSRGRSVPAWGGLAVIVAIYVSAALSFS
jgi:hypothetical protein